MKNVHVKRVFTLSLTADDWSLFSFDNYGVQMTEKRDAAAQDINRVAEEALNSGDLTYAGAKAAIEAVLEKYSDLGADDTEGHDVMYELLALKKG